MGPIGSLKNILYPNVTNKMENVFFALAFTLITSFGFASSNIEIKENLDMLYVCTITTTTTVNTGDGNSYEVSVTNTANTCFEAWSANQSEIEEFTQGVTPAK